MQGTIDQILSLVIHGNYARRHAVPAGYFPAHRAFTFCEYVRFFELAGAEGTLLETAFAEDPLGWFRRLIAEGCEGFRVVHVETRDSQFSDRMTVGLVGGGGRWLIEALFADGADLWEASWSVGDKNHPKQLIWQVKYGRVRKRGPRWLYQGEALRYKIDSLKEALADTLHFAQRHDLPEFAACFQRGIDCLDLSAPLPEALRNYAPADFLDAETEHLLAACHAGWVFGAMGSWNDLGFDGEEQENYNKLSDRLFWRMVHSAITACNMTCVARQEAAVRKPWWKPW